MMNQVNRFIRKWIFPDKAILLFCIGLLILVWGRTWWQIDYERVTSLELLMRDGDKLTRAFEEHVRRVLKLNEQSLMLLKDNYETANGVTESTHHLIALLAKDPLVVQIGLLGTDGHLLASLRPDRAFANYFFTPRFQAHVVTDTGQYFLDQTSLGPVSGIFSIPLSVRLNQPDGGFAGVAYISINPEYFNKFYWDMNFNADYVVRIVGQDGFIRVSNNNSEIGVNMARADLWTYAHQIPQGFYQTQGLFSGKSLLMSYRSLVDYPLIVQVGVSENALIPVTERRNLYLASAGGISLIIFFFGSSLIRFNRRHRLSEEYFQAVVTNTPIIIYALDRHGIFTLSEGLGLHKLGLQRGEVVGKSALEIYRDYPDIIEAIEITLKGQYAFFEHYVAGIWLANRLVPIFDETGQVKAASGAALDITDRKQAEQKLQQSEEALRHTNEELEMRVEQRTAELTALNEELIATNTELIDTHQCLVETQDSLARSERMIALARLVAGVAHEINTPVGVCITTASHLRDVCVQFARRFDAGTLRRADLREFLTECQEMASLSLGNAERAAQLIRNFKQVSVEQTNENPREINLKDYLGEIILMLSSQIPHFTPRVLVSCDESLMIAMFPKAFSQIITNLLLNSLNHAYEDHGSGVIHITVEISDLNLVVVYEDDGKGMDVDVLSKIFDPFFTTRRNQGGTGLGLSIVYNLVTQLYKGTITCTSIPRKGTSFHIALPLLPRKKH